MDAARERWIEENGKKVKKYLFPECGNSSRNFLKRNQKQNKLPAIT
jgi:hypothetical protein